MRQVTRKGWRSCLGRSYCRFQLSIPFRVHLWGPVCMRSMIRGKFRSKPWQQLLEEAKYLVESGVKELNLIAEDTNQYGQDRRDGKGLAQLMHELGKLEGLQWMRILYAYPSYFTDDLIDEIAINPKVCKYIDIPLQHISNMTLLSMNRPPQEHTVKLLQKLRQRIPGLVLRTTFISGFPGDLFS
ncbi:hypothetical protein ABBQ32_003490 [Trebouxia sp. C0010 RCD-2024]